MSSRDENPTWTLTRQRTADVDAKIVKISCTECTQEVTALMTMLNIRFQLDTPKGMVDVHAFVTEQEDGNYLVYCRKGNEQTSRVVQTFPMAVECIKAILDRIDTEVARCASLPCALTA